MAWYECSSGGGTLTETVLWTNTSPTSNFAAQNVTLNDSVQNYEYIKITIRQSTSDDSLISAIYSVEDLAKATGVNNHVGLCLPTARTTNTKTRIITKASDTSITVNQANQIGGTTSDNSICIPTQITGLK